MALVKGYDIEVPESRAALVETLQADVRQAKRHFDADFKAMLEDMVLAHNGAPKNWPKDYYKVNITQRFVRQKVAQLYAKNPRVQAKRKQKLQYVIWDETMQSLQNAMMQVQQAAEVGMMPPPDAVALLQEVQSVAAFDRMLDKVGKTLERCFEYYMAEQIPSFKAQMKGCVRAAVQTAVGYLELGFQRETELSPENKAKIADHHQRMAHIKRLIADLGPDGDKTELDAEAEELRLAVQALQKQQQVVIREGLVFDFPKSTAIIPDPNCTSLTGWIGADWIAKEIFMTPDEIKEFYEIDLGKDSNNYKTYSTSTKAYKQNPRNDLTDKRDDLCCVWIMWYKPSGLKFELCDGYKDFLREPEAPDVAVERFFPIYALCFNELEHPDKIFPPSDVRTITPQQMELNRSRQSLREHRKANRPGYVTPKGALNEKDKENLSGHQISGVIELEGLTPGQSVTDFIQSLPKTGVDPNLYETTGIFDDIYKSVGMMESHFGGTSGATATEVATGEQARTGALEAEVDQLNDFLTEVARDAAQVMFMELDPMTVQEIAGRAAVWPTMNRAQIAQELSLDVAAGSNGRPNKVMRQQALQMLTPYLIQIPGVNPEWLGRQLIESIDDSLDLADAFKGSLPSIQMMNNAPPMQPGGAPGDDPASQGAEGANNAEQADVQPQQATPSIAAPGHGGPGRPPLVPLPASYSQ